MSENNFSALWISKFFSFVFKLSSLFFHNDLLEWFLLICFIVSDRGAKANLII